MTNLDISPVVALPMKFDVILRWAKKITTLQHTEMLCMLTDSPQPTVRGNAQN